MTNDLNPYHVEQPMELIRPSLVQRFLPIVAGGVVVVATAVTMLAFLFGLLVATAGKSAPSPLNFSAVADSSIGRVFRWGALAVVPISLMMGGYLTARILRVQRNLLDARNKRLELRKQVEAIRQAHCN